MTYLTIRMAARDAELRLERTRLRRVLDRAKWSPRTAARVLHVSASTLYRALDRHPGLRRELHDRAPPPGRKKAATN